MKSRNTVFKGTKGQEVYPKTLLSNVFSSESSTSNILNSEGKIKSQFLSTNGGGGSGGGISDVQVNQVSVVSDGTAYVDLTDYATTDYVDKKVSDLVSSAPGTLDTLKQISDALSGDANFAQTIVSLINQKQNIIDEDHKIDFDLISGVIPEGTVYKAGYGIQLSQDSAFSISSTVALKSDIQNYTNGSGIDISDDNEISVASSVALKSDIPTYTEGTGISISDQNEVSIDDTVVAKLDSPEFSGTPTAPTPTKGDETTKIATTEFIKNAFSYELTNSSGYQKFNSGLILKYGTETIAANDTQQKSIEFEDDAFPNYCITCIFTPLGNANVYCTKLNKAYIWYKNQACSTELTVKWIALGF